MKLLFDENLSPRLISLLRDVFPESLHVSTAGLARASDEEVWRFAAEEGFTIVSKDSDFHQRSFLHGAPPKVIWVRVGNATTSRVEAVLRASHPVITTFLLDTEAAFLVLGSDLQGS